MARKLPLRCRFRTLSWACVAGALLVTQEVRASDDASERAKQHFQRGYALAAQGDFAAAIEEFEGAQAVSPNVSLLYNLGQAYAAAGRSSDAVTTLERYLSEAADEVTPERRRQVETLLRYHSARIGRVALQVSPAGARVVVDGKLVGVAPLARDLALPAGAHALIVTAPGFEPTAVSLDVQPKDSKSVKVELEPLAIAGEFLLLDCRLPDVEISLDGAPIAVSSMPATLPVRLGSHLVRFSRAGYFSDEHRVTIAPRSALRLSCGLRADASSAHARLRVRHPAGSAVLVDGVPFKGQPLPPGAHEVRVDAAFGGETRPVVLSATQVTELTLRWPSTSDARLLRDAERRRTLRIASYVAAGVGLASAIVATALYVDTSSRWRDWDQQNQALRRRSGEPSGALLGDVDRLLDDENALRNRDAAAVGLGVAGGVLLAGAASLFLVSRTPADTWVLTGRGDVGLAYHGSF